jgi:hypothetical protein
MTTVVAWLIDHAILIAFFALSFFAFCVGYAAGMYGERSATRDWLEQEEHNGHLHWSR